MCFGFSYSSLLLFFLLSSHFFLAVLGIEPCLSCTEGKDHHGFPTWVLWCSFITLFSLLSTYKVPFLWLRGMPFSLKRFRFIIFCVTPLGRHHSKTNEQTNKKKPKKARKPKTHNSKWWYQHWLTGFTSAWSLSWLVNNGNCIFKISRMIKIHSVKETCCPTNLCYRLFNTLHFEKSYTCAKNGLRFKEEKVSLHGMPPSHHTKEHKAISSKNTLTLFILAWEDANIYWGAKDMCPTWQQEPNRAQSTAVYSDLALWSWKAGNSPDVHHQMSR